jgi:hypothetical protein
MLFIATSLAGCGWEPLVPAPPPGAESPTPAELRAEIVYECSSCVRPEGEIAPLTFTFRARVALPEGEEVLVYNWDFGDGTKDEGEHVTHTYERPGRYRVELHVITSAGEEAWDELMLQVQPPPKPEARVQRDSAEGQLCYYERVLPEAVKVGDTFKVQVTIRTKQDVQVVVWEENVWFPEFHLLQEPFQLWIGLEAGETKTLAYEVQLWQAPAIAEPWMSGTLSCNPGGNSESEILTLKSQINVIEGEAP